MKNSAINTRIGQLLSEPGGTEKLAAAGSPWIKDQVYEEAFSTHIVSMDNKSIEDPDIQVSTHNDQLYQVIPVDTVSTAMSVNIRGDADPELIRAPRMAAAFYSVTSAVYDVYEESLMAYQKVGQPLTKIIEERIPLDLQTIMDRGWLINVEAAVQAMQLEANGGTLTALSATTVTAGSVVEYSAYKGANARTGTLSATPQAPARADWGTAKNILAGKQLIGAKLLMSDWDWNNQMALTHEELGTGTFDTYKGGFDIPTVGGLQVVKTIKTDILRPGNMYVFTDESFFGRISSIGDLKFYIEKKANKITFQGRWMISMAVVNVNAVGKIELYTGDASGKTVDAILTATTPKGEDDLWTVNNRVDSGVYFPDASVF